MAALGILAIWLVLGIAGAVATARWAQRLWKRRKELSVPLAALAVISVSAAMWASLGAVIGLTRAYGAIGGESIDPTHKARILAEGISETMNSTVFGIMVWLPGVVVLLIATRKRQT